VVQGIGWAAVAWTLTFLLGAVRARESGVPAYIRYLALVGAPLAAVGIVGYIAAYGVQAQHFVRHGSQTYPQANHLMSAPVLAVFQVMDYGGELLLAVAFVLVSMQAMRVGLLTRFMGYLGIIAGILFTAGYIKVFTIPIWVILAAHTAIGLGTLSGGWRIIHTMGSKITKLQPVGGFAAETAGAATLFLASSFGIPVSTTHTITGAIVGVGSTRRLSAVRWGVAGQIVWAWVLTIPCAAIIGTLTFWICKLFGAQ